MIKTILTIILFAFVLSTGAQETQEFTEDELMQIAAQIDPYISVNKDCLKDCAKGAFPCALKHALLCLIRIQPAAIASCVAIKCGLQSAGCMTRCFHR